MENLLVKQCFDFCRYLETVGKPFLFKLKLGNDFTFILDSSKTNATSNSRKKVSPSTARRNARRKQEFLNKNTVSPASPVVVNSEDSIDLEFSQPVNKCDVCDEFFNSAKGLNIHKAHKHRISRSPIIQLDGGIEIETKTTVVDLDNDGVDPAKHDKATETRMETRIITRDKAIDTKTDRKEWYKCILKKFPKEQVCDGLFYTTEGFKEHVAAHFEGCG